jgi:N-acetylglucosaminyl-diphospho-decaprenol L-rhamnosyltransferase
VSAVVSVLVVNYRSYYELDACLTAVVADSGAIPVELTVVDQQSDASAVATIRQRFPTASIVASPGNDGFAAGVNRAARQTEGRYLLVINPDAVLGRGLIATLARWLDVNQDVAVVGPRIFNPDGSVQPSARRFPDLTTGLGGRMSWLTRVAPSNWLSRRNLDWSRAYEPIDVDWVSGACMMIRRSAFEAVGGMDEQFFLYWEDADLCRRLRTAGHRTMYVPTVSAVHEGSRGSRHAAARALVAFHRSAFRYYWKHGGLLARAMAPLAQVVLWTRLVLKLAALRRPVDATSIDKERTKT